MLMHFHAYVPSFSYILIYYCVGTFLILSLSLSPFLCQSNSMGLKRKSTPSQNPLRFGASFSSDPTPSSIQFHDENARNDLSENFCRRGIHSECHAILSDFSDTNLPIVIHDRGWESFCDILVTYPFVIIQDFYSNIHRIDTLVPHFFSHVRGMRIVVTLEIVSKVLHIPKVAHPDYPGCDCLRIVSKDKLISHFCGTPSVQGGKLNTARLGFAKGLRFLNMVMTFTLMPLSHYNSIIKPHAHFLLSLMEDPTIDFPSHFIASVIDVYQDTATHDQLIFPSAITQILQHFSIPIPLSPLFTIMGAISTSSVRWSEAQL